MTEPKTYGTPLGVITAVNGGIAGVDAPARGFRRQPRIPVGLPDDGRRGDPRHRSGRRPGPRVRSTRRGRMDRPGVALLAVSVGSLLIALNEADELAAANWLLVAALVVAAAAFGLSWRTGDRNVHPLGRHPAPEAAPTWATLLTTPLTGRACSPS